MFPVCFVHQRRRKSTASSGFTLVEVMIVVVLIGLLAAIAVPAFSKARSNSMASRLANDFRVFANSFEVHNIASGEWAEDGDGNSVPADVEPYLRGTSWTLPAPNNGTWDWEKDRHGVTAAVALTADSADSVSVFEHVDQLLDDDGDLGTGRFQFVADRYIYILAF